jgi:DNA-binding CsgD family transcriptional regulator/tetratricopeptide (TPR) repeat protein
MCRVWDVISERVHESRPVGRATFSEAMRAWFLGDFEGCLALCDRVRAHDVDMVSQLALLRARALLRLGRNDEAIGVVCDVFVAHGTLDASLTARMLLGTGYVRSGEYRRGLEILQDAYRASEDAHPTIRSEIALNVALGHYCLRELPQADRALDLVSPGADIVHARAFEYRGWVAVGRGDYGVALTSFRAALERLDGCRHYDRFLEGHTLQALAILAAERLDRMAWLFVEHRSERFDWSNSGLETPRHSLQLYASMQYEADGRIHDALRIVADAERAAPTVPLRLQAQCRRAAILRSSKEPFAHFDAVARIRHEFEQLDLAALRGDDAQLPLAVAEETAYTGDALGARALLKRYDEMSDAAAGLSSLTDDPRLTGIRAFVEAVVADAGGEHRLAHARYRESFQIFHRIGYERRALLAALRLGELTGHAYLFEYVDRTVRKLSPASALRARARRQNPTLTDPVVSDLSRTERTVLQLLCDGKSTVEIAEARGRSKQTIRNTISRILTAFEVPDRPALLRECLRRGLIAR